MKLSNITARWILVLPAIVTTFTVLGFGGAWQFHILDNNSWAVVCLIVAVLSGSMVAPLQVLHGKRFVTFMSVLFILSCIFPPWRSIYYHKPDSYSVLFDPPTTSGGIQIDFGRLFLEWAALAAVTGMVWVLFVKPARPRDDKAKRTPTGKPE